jgi:hypothetical protein
LLCKTPLDDYEDVLAKYLDKYMITNQNLDGDKIAKLKKDFVDTLAKCMIVFNNNPFVDTTKEKGKQSLVHYDLLMWSFKPLSLKYIKEKKDKIAEKFKELCLEDKFIRTLSGGLQKKSSLLKRREIWSQKLESING